jgi:hypothetical protein
VGTGLPALTSLAAELGGRGMGKHRPDYLNRVEVRHTSVVVLRPDGRSKLPRTARQRQAQTPPDQDIQLGWVVAHEAFPGLGRRTRATVWTFTCDGQPDHGSARYHSRHDAAESCAVQAIDGPAARQRFDTDRWHNRRPDDN